MLEDYAVLSDAELAQAVLRRRQETGLDYRSADTALGLLQEMNAVDWHDRLKYALTYWEAKHVWRVVALASDCIEWQYPDAASPAVACCLAWLLWTAEHERFQ